MLSLRSFVGKHLSSACSIARRESRLLSTSVLLTEALNDFSRLAKPTHVLTLPMYSDPEMWAKMAELRETLIKDAPKTGLDPATVIPNVKVVLEYRLGKFIIKNNETRSWNFPHSCEHSQIMEVLDSLKVPIREVLDKMEVKGDLRLPLGDVGPKNSNHKRLMLTGIRGPEFQAVMLITQLVHQAFKESQTMVKMYRVPIPGTVSFKPTLLPSRRPPFLTSTIIDSSYATDRKPREKLKSFNLDAIYSSSIFKPWPPTERSPEGNPFLRRVDLGTALIPGLYLRPDAMPDLNSPELPHDGKLDFADC